MSQSVDYLGRFGRNYQERIERAISSIQAGGGVMIVDDNNRENEGDLVFSAEQMTEQQMALMIRECSGIVCLCLTDEKIKELDLPMMVENNTRPFQTAFTISIEAKECVTTGVSAHDRLTTIKAAIKDGATPADLTHPGHVFPLRARENGVLTRRGHTEATVDICRLAGFKPCGVLCELTNIDGTMARLPGVTAFGIAHGFPVISIEDISEYRQATGK